MKTAVPFTRCGFSIFRLERKRSSGIAASFSSAERAVRPLRHVNMMNAVAIAIMIVMYPPSRNCVMLLTKKRRSTEMSATQSGPMSHAFQCQTRVATR